MSLIVPDQSGELVLTESRTMRVGHIYAVQFSSGVLKVGQTTQPKTRLADHAKAAQAHGHSVAETLVSPPHVNYCDNERLLIAFCEEQWRLIAGREYFADADIEAVVRFTNAMTFTVATQAQLDAIANEGMEERRRRAMQLALAEPFADEILRAAKFGGAA